MPNYSDLQQDIANWIARDDLITVIPTFITLAEAKISRELRPRAMERTEVVSILDTTADGYPNTNLTDRFMEFRAVKYRGEVIDYVTPEQFDLAENYLEFYYTIRGQELVFSTNMTGVEVDLTYFQRFEPLTDTNPTNWLTDNAYDLLLYGSLIHAGIYMKDDGTIRTATDQYNYCKTMINEVEEDARYSGKTLAQSAFYG